MLHYSSDFEWFAGHGVNRFNFIEDVWDVTPSFGRSYCEKCGKLVKRNCEEVVFPVPPTGGRLCGPCGMDAHGMAVGHKFIPTP